MHICMIGAVQAPAEEQQQQLAPPQQGPGLPAVIGLTAVCWSSSLPWL